MSLIICTKNKDYYGIYKNSKDYQLKLGEIAETKQQIKQYMHLLRSERENISSGARKLTDSIIDIVKDYFSKRGKLV